MRIDLPHVADCPNLAVARERIAIALERTGAAATVHQHETPLPKKQSVRR